MYTHSLHKDPSLESLYNLCEKKAQVTMQLCLNLDEIAQNNIL